MGNIIKIVCFVPQTSPTNVVWQCQSVLASKVQPRARIQCWASECSGQLLPSVPSARPRQQQHRLIELLALLLGIIHSRSQLQILLAPLFFLLACPQSHLNGQSAIPGFRRRERGSTPQKSSSFSSSSSAAPHFFFFNGQFRQHCCPPLLIYLFSLRPILSSTIRLFDY